MALEKEPVILIVEDETSFSQVLSDILKECGFRTITATKLPIAMKMAMNQKFDLILLDFVIESGTGDKLVEYIRRDARGYNHATPVLMISGFLNTDILKSLGNKISGALIKPFDKSVFTSKVQSICPIPFKKAAA